MKYRKKPVVVEAFQMTRQTRLDNRDWPEWLNRAWNFERDQLGAVYPDCTWIEDGLLKVNTLEGPYPIAFGDWIIRGVKGELYPCKPDVFEVTYEAAGEGKPKP